MWKSVLFIVIAIIGLVISAHAMIPPIQITDGFVRASMPGVKVSAAFMKIQNNSAEDDRLLSVTTEFSRRSEIHITKMDNGIMRMRLSEDGIVVPKGEQIILEPGGFHIMLMGLKQELKHGMSVKISLHFKNAGKINLNLPIQER